MKTRRFMNSKKEGHGETCKCRRCRAREESIERRPVRFKVSDLQREFSTNVQYQSDDDD